MSQFTTLGEVAAIVKEELNSYFSSGAIDDVLFPKWVEYAMQEFKKSALPIKVVPLTIDNFSAELPKDFDSVKEVWACGVLFTDDLKNFSSLYYQTDCRITPIDDKCNECFDDCDRCSGEYPKKDEKYRVTHKVTGVTHYEYYFSHLLRPGNKNALNMCHSGSPNLLQRNSDQEFDIRDCKIITNFREGFLHLVYYGKNVDEDGNLLIIDNVFIKNYLVLFLKYKVFESLSNSINDESLNQLFSKMQYYKQEYISAKITAQTELKKWDKWQVADQVVKRRNRYNNYRRALR